ncbi:DUF5928 domain-containing protein [Roseovarius sp. D22-M7]|uniref:DUF5928 domain-containing protein n=1 Tax=Roseovarius sp. D22-M7 TaxID=3127116 RepID=UPI0030104339
MLSSYFCAREQVFFHRIGGIQTSIDKRTRHRRALMRMLFDHYGSDQLIICIDPGSLDLLRDFCSDRSTTRILEIRCRFSTDDLAGHAIRLGLVGHRTPPDALARLSPTLCGDLEHESDRIRDAGFENHLVLREAGDRSRDADLLARFLDIPAQTAQDIVDSDHFFAD